MKFIKTPTKGMRDIMPKDMELREYVLRLMKDTYRKFGFEIIQTPVVEHIENLTSNQGGENEKLIFKVLKRGEKLNLETATSEEDLVDAGLRYDLTVPLSRFYSNNMNLLPMPFRAFQMGNVYRAERSQKGRYREFLQCDLDILGEKTNVAEIELITAVTTFLQKLDFKGFVIKINDRRILTKMVEYAGFPSEKLDAILIALDKLDKIGKDGVSNDLESLGLEKEKIDKYLSLFDQTHLSFTSFCELFSMDQKVVDNLNEIMETVKCVVSANVIFDPTLVRGMGYYTGPIFEIGVEDFASSIGGGGRYDKMVEKYANVSVPACGFSVGFERLLLLLEERGFKVPEDSSKKAYIIHPETDKKEVFEKISQDRNSGEIVKILYRSKNFKFQKESLESEGYQIIEW